MNSFKHFKAISDTSILVGNAPQPTKITGTSNSSLGMDCLNSLTSGEGNSVFGNNALYAVITSSDKTTIGVNSLLSCTGGSNSCLGYNAGSLITSGSGNISIGVGSASGSLDNTVSDNIYIGNGPEYYNKWSRMRYYKNIDFDFRWNLYHARSWIHIYNIQFEYCPK